MAQPASPSLPPNATIVASGLINPRGFTFAPDGALVVAESGAVPDGFEAPHGPPTPMFRPATTTTGRVSRVDLATGQRTTLAEGLPSSAGSFGDTLGPSNVAYLGTDLYVLISAGPVHGWPNYPSGVYKVNAGRHGPARRQPGCVQLQESRSHSSPRMTRSATRTTWSPPTGRCGSPTAIGPRCTR